MVVGVQLSVIVYTGEGDSWLMSRVSLRAVRHNV